MHTISTPMSIKTNDGQTVETVDTFTMVLSSVNGQVRDPENLGFTMNAGPYTITATAFTGFRFKHWADSEGNIITTNASLRLEADSMNRFNAGDYVAVFEELPAVEITYVVENINGAYLSNPGETVNCFSGNPTGSVATIRPGYIIDGWYNESNVKVSSSVEFVPTTATDSANISADDHLFSKQTYTLKVVADLVSFKISYRFQCDSDGLFVKDHEDCARVHGFRSEDRANRRRLDFDRLR